MTITSKCMSFTTKSTGGEYKHKLSIDEMPSHNHRVPDQADDNSSFKTYDWGEPMLLGTKRATKNKGYWWSITEWKGGDKSHNNLQPYVVTYFWRRVS